MSTPDPAMTDTGGDPAEWHRYFDELDAAMHDFEACLARRDIEPMRIVELPAGAPPEELRGRWLVSYQRISELEFRALAMREELRVQFGRLHGTRHRAADGYGSSLDITG